MNTAQPTPADPKTPEEVRQQAIQLSNHFVDAINAANASSLEAIFDALLVTYFGVIDQYPQATGHCALVLGRAAAELLKQAAQQTAPIETTRH